uniref:Acetylglutamate kinase n=1 Tax=uncultured Acidobacteriota bacterium TaxID=171953 RepID=G8DPL8_9BACT|nr:N-acetylglutamate kinase [uncultured Acidobacteriota bacterium]
MKALIKIGGTLLDSVDSRRRLAAEIGRAHQDGLHAVVVHGGGRQMTRFLEERGIESRFVNGLRVTTPEVLDAVLKIFAGSVNQQLVAAFIASGVLAVGLSGMDGLLTEARQLSAELGFVGKPVRSDAGLLNLLLENSYLPVIACVAGDRQGHFFNVNADQMAASVAAAMQAKKLFFLTDVDGVWGEEKVIYPTITVDKCKKLIDDQIASGGMRAKLEAAIEALQQGVAEVVIAPGGAAGIIDRLLSGDNIGTRLTADVMVPGGV